MDDLRAVVVVGARLDSERLAEVLRRRGWAVVTADDGDVAERLAASCAVDVVVAELDAGLPFRGVALARRVRVPTVLVGARASADRTMALLAGASACLPADADVDEIAAQVMALGRNRTGAAPAPSEELVIDDGAHVVWRRGVIVDLTPTEFALLDALARRPKQVVSKSTLLADLWDADVYDPNVVEVHLCRLRRKLHAHGMPVIDTIRGVGYVLTIPAVRVSPDADGAPVGGAP